MDMSLYRDFGSLEPMADNMQSDILLSIRLRRMPREASAKTEVPILNQTVKMTPSAKVLCPPRQVLVLDGLLAILHTPQQYDTMLDSHVSE